jgi:hypothetical protein
MSKLGSQAAVRLHCSSWSFLLDAETSFGRRAFRENVNAYDVTLRAGSVNEFRRSERIPHAPPAGLLQSIPSMSSRSKRRQGGVAIGLPRL